jgi:predicted Zn-dependent protease
VKITKLLRKCRPFGIVVLVVFLCSCALNPYTERRQLLLLPQSYENELGAQAYEQVLHDPKIGISQNQQEVEPVKRVSARIIEAATQSRYSDLAKQFDWEISVIKDDETKNAFALPGGKIAVYTGIFPIAKNEAGLAAILGHEVTHALARHGAERMSQGLVAEIILTGSSMALAGGGTEPGTRQAIMQALGLGAEVGVILPYSREHESEADYIGVLLAAQAGYDPREAIRVWQRMKMAGGEEPPKFLSTHPSHEKRIEELEYWMIHAMREFRKASPAPPTPELPRIAQ